MHGSRLGLFRLLLAATLAAVSIFPKTPNAATITLADINPVNEKCLLKGTHIDYNPWIFGPRGECESEDTEPRYTPEEMRQRGLPPDNPTFWDGTMSPRARGAYAHMFVADGGSTYFDRNYTVTFAALRDAPVIRISGEIVQGDLDRLKKLIEETDSMICAAPGFCPYNSTISLDSPGGNLAEAIRIAEYIRDHQFQTLLEPGTRCESSCAFLFFAGYTNYGGLHFPRRYADITARLGVHRPAMRVAEAEYGAQDIARTAQLVNNVLAQAMQLFVDARIDLDVLKQMYDTPAESMSYLTTDQLAQNAVVLGRNQQPNPKMTRGRALSFCASEFSRIDDGAPLELLNNLHVGVDSFIAFADYGRFYCAGARLEDNFWYTETCTPDMECALRQCDEGSYGEDVVCPDNPADPYGDYTFLVSYASLNLALGTLPGPVLLDFVKRGLHHKHGTSLSSRIDPHQTYAAEYLMLSAPFPSVPHSYCGHIDFRDPMVTKKLQTALNTAGYDAGPADGVPGKLTQAAVLAASTELLKTPDNLPSIALLLALGVPTSEVETLRLCHGSQ